MNNVLIDFSKDSLSKHVDELKKNVPLINSSINSSKSDYISQPSTSKLKNFGSVESYTTRETELNNTELLSETEKDNHTELFNETQFLKDYYKINGSFLV